MNNMPKTINSGTNKVSFKKLHKFIKENTAMLNDSKITYWNAVDIIKEECSIRTHSYCAMD